MHHNDMTDCWSLVSAEIFADICKGIENLTSNLWWA